MTDELERFKSEISLIDFAVNNFWYELIKSESSASSKVLKSGGDKIFVTRQDGHDYYFSTVDGRDCGSIIDFLETRKNVNLGQVRKELRLCLLGPHENAQNPARNPWHVLEVNLNEASMLQKFADETTANVLIDLHEENESSTFQPSGG